MFIQRPTKNKKIPESDLLSPSFFYKTVPLQKKTSFDVIRKEIKKIIKPIVELFFNLKEAAPKQWKFNAPLEFDKSSVKTYRKPLESQLIQKIANLKKLMDEKNLLKKFINKEKVNRSLKEIKNLTKQLNLLPHWEREVNVLFDELRLDNVQFRIERLNLLSQIIKVDQLEKCLYSPKGGEEGSNLTSRLGIEKHKIELQKSKLQEIDIKKNKLQKFKLKVDKFFGRQKHKAEQKKVNDSVSKAEFNQSCDELGHVNTFPSSQSFNYEAILKEDVDGYLAPINKSSVNESKKSEFYDKLDHLRPSSSSLSENNPHYASLNQERHSTTKPSPACNNISGDDLGYYSDNEKTSTSENKFGFFSKTKMSDSVKQKEQTPSFSLGVSCRV